MNEFGSSTIPKPGSEEFEALVAKDMAINIYRDGKVGRYGHIFISQGQLLKESVFDIPINNCKQIFFVSSIFLCR